jgi:hypothetical protein
MNFNMGLITPDVAFDKARRKNMYKNSHESKGGLLVDKQPDPKKHQLVSFIKSGIRISGYICLPFDLGIACLILVFSELVGILEELV